MFLQVFFLNPYWNELNLREMNECLHGLNLDILSSSEKKELNSNTTSCAFICIFKMKELKKLLFWRMEKEWQSFYFEGGKGITVCFLQRTWRRHFGSVSSWSFTLEIFGLSTDFRNKPPWVRVWLLVQSQIVWVNI